MSLQYDAGTKTATDPASGLAVEFISDDPPQEAQSVFCLHWDGQRHLFKVEFDAGYNDLQRANPGMSTRDVTDLMFKQNIRNYYLGMVPGLPSASIILGRVDEFIGLFAMVVRDRVQTKNVRIVFDPVKADKSLSRAVIYPPLRSVIEQ